MDKKERRLLVATHLLRKLQILRLVESCPSISQNKISQQLEYAVSAVNRIVRELQVDGSLIRHSDGWRVTEKGQCLADELSTMYHAELNSLSKTSFITQSSSREVVSIGVLRSLGTAIPLVARELGLFAAAGIEAEQRQYDFATEILEDILDGHVSFGYGGMAAFLEQKGERPDVEFLAACNSGGHALIVKRSLGITDLTDLRGRAILVPPEGTVSHRLMSTFIRSRVPDTFDTLHLDSSVSPANMLYALQLNDQYAGMVLWEPWVSLAELRSPGLVVLIDFEKLWRDSVGKSYSTAVLCAQTRTALDHPELVRRLLRIHRSTIEFLNQEPQEGDRIIADVLNMPLDVIQAGRKRVSFHSDLQW